MRNNGHHSFLEGLLFWCRSTCMWQIRIAFFFALPSVDLVHRHCVGEHFFGLDIDLFQRRTWSKGSVLHEDFPGLSQCVLGCFPFLFKAPSRPFPSCDPCESSLNIHLEPLPWRLPEFFRPTAAQAQSQPRVKSDSVARPMTRDCPCV